MGSEEQPGVYLQKNFLMKFRNVLRLLNNRYQKLKETYPKAYTDWDFQKLTFETNKISLLCNPLEAENKEPWMGIPSTSLCFREKKRLSTPPISSAERDVPGSYRPEGQQYSP